MPIDTSIYSQLAPQRTVEGPLDQFGRAMQIRGLLGQTDLQDLQIRQAQDTAARQGKLRELFSAGQPTPEQISAIDPKMGMDYRKYMLDTEKSQADLAKTKAEAFAKNVSTMRDLTAQVRGDADMPLLRETAMRLFGPDVASKMNIPDRFDPAWQRAQITSADELLKRVMPVPPAGHTMKPDGSLSPIDPNYLAGRKDIAAAGAAKVTVPVDLRAEGKFADAVGTKMAERVIGQYDSAEAAVENLHKLNLTLKQIKESDAITGPGAEVFTNIERARQLFLADKQAGKRVSDTELLDSLLGSDVFPMIKALGIGARGLDTPAEREFLRSVMTGVTPMNKQTLIRMTEIRKAVAERAIDKWNEKVESGELDKFFKASGIPKAKIQKPSFESAPAAPAPATPTAPALGQREDGYIYKGGDPAAPSSWERAR